MKPKKPREEIANKSLYSSVHRLALSNQNQNNGLVGGGPNQSKLPNTQRFLQKRDVNAAEHNPASIHFDVGLEERASRELLGSETSSAFLRFLFAKLQEFIQDWVISKNYQGTPPSAIDHLWQIVISYTEEYSKLCETNLLKKIHRAKGPVCYELCKELQDIEWDIDEETSFWMSESQSLRVSQIIRQELVPGRETSLVQIQGLAKKVKEVFGTQPYSRDFGLHINENALESKISAALASVTPILEEELSTHLLYEQPFPSKLLEEYKRFLYLLSSSFYIPSPLISFVWFLHCGLTHEYTTFCETVYGSLRPFIHTNWVEGLDQDYKHTKEEYRTIFNQEPPSSIWPATYNDKYRWVSIFRLTRAIEAIPLDTPQLEEAAQEYYAQGIGTFNLV